MARQLMRRSCDVVLPAKKAMASPDRLADFGCVAAVPCDSGKISGNLRRLQRYNHRLQLVFFTSALLSVRAGSVLGGGPYDDLVHVDGCRLLDGERDGLGDRLRRDGHPVTHLRDLCSDLRIR